MKERLSHAKCLTTKGFVSHDFYFALCARATRTSRASPTSARRFLLSFVTNGRGPPPDYLCTCLRYTRANLVVRDKALRFAAFILFACCCVSYFLSFRNRFAVVFNLSDSDSSHRYVCFEMILPIVRSVVLLLDCLQVLVACAAPAVDTRRLLPGWKTDE